MNGPGPTIAALPEVQLQSVILFAKHLLIMIPGSGILFDGAWA